jgi:two-component sensor histidine kinase
MKVDSDDSSAPADASVSLGLIVTERVINALKHAFPGDRGGDILVLYRSAASGSDWTLSVADNGVGVPRGADAPKAGLGGSIVDALARQLDARVLIADADPGAHMHPVVGAAKTELAQEI